jgi:methyl-accepting chemotaxis protein
MKFRSSAPAALIAAAVVVVGGLGLFSAQLFSNLTSSVEEGQFQLMRSILDTSLKRAADEALARADIIASSSIARQAVAAKDRAKLQGEFAEMFAIQKDRRGVDQVQFHLPPATSLLRLHAPQRFDDDLTKFRPMIVVVNRERTARNGFAIAASGPAIFGVAPVADAAGTHVGSVEFGLDFGPLLNSLKAAYGLEFTLFVEEQPLREFGTGVSPSVFGEQNRIGAYIRYHTTNSALFAELANDTDLASTTDAKTYNRDAQGVPYGVLLMPIRDNAGNRLGVVAVARDFSASRAASGRSMLWLLCFSIFGVVILAGAAIVVVRGFLLRPIQVVDERLHQLAAGERSTLTEPDDKFCEEVSQLAAHCEELAERNRALVDAR